MDKISFFHLSPGNEQYIEVCAHCFLDDPGKFDGTQPDQFFSGTHLVRGERNVSQVTHVRRRLFRPGIRLKREHVYVKRCWQSLLFFVKLAEV
ncbi:MAG: hypothetical protein WBF26_02385, partial [Candidatus Sulfotelmatobacter sp.]